MGWLKDFLLRRTTPTSKAGQTYVMDIEWERSEELRPDRLGPTQQDVQDPERPTKTLGPY